jgi:hypothetical protein
LAWGAAWHAAPLVGSALAVGLLAYGCSLVLFVLALRQLGTARTGAYFSVAPFFGALVAVLGLGEPLTMPLLIAGLLMAIGIGLHLSERHGHPHMHGVLEHEHAHVHGAHHQHGHDGFPPGGCGSRLAASRPPLSFNPCTRPSSDSRKSPFPSLPTRAFCS